MILLTLMNEAKYQVIELLDLLEHIKDSDGRTPRSIESIIQDLEEMKSEMEEEENFDYLKNKFQYLIEEIKRVMESKILDASGNITKYIIKDENRILELCDRISDYFVIPI